MNKLSVIIVSYNVKYYLEQCLHSLQRALQGIDSTIYVVDNHSQDGSVAYLKERFPDITLISSTHNNGFSYANNVALRLSDSEYVLLLNPDTFVGETTIRQMLAFFDEHEQAGGVGVQMLNADGTKAMESRRGLPTPSVAFYKMSGLCSRYPQSRKYGKYYMSYLPWEQAGQIEVVSGACFMIRRSVLDQIGLLDETFFMYGEDIDLSYRILKAGYQNWYVPARILHYKGESTQKSSFRYVHVFYQAMLIFFKKHYKHLSFWLSIPIKAAIYLKATTALLSMQVRQIRKSLGMNVKRVVSPYYVFIGNNDMIARCREISRQQGLNAEFVTGNLDTIPDGYALPQVNPQLQYIFVYDMQAFSYESVLEIFSHNMHPNISLGTFDINTGIIITPKEILL